MKDLLWKKLSAGPQIGPSLLAADFSNLEASMAKIEAEMDYLHFDIMDGHFVPQLSFGPLICKAVRPLTKKLIDVHLMVTNPQDLLPALKDAGADMVSVHVETVYHGHRVIQQIQELDMRAGIVLNPMTPLAAAEEYIPYADYIMLMSVNPGYGGQKFIDSTLPRIRKLRQLIDTSEQRPLLEVDGGVGLANIEAIVAAGADLLVAGSAVFGANDPLERIRQLRNMALAAK